MSDEHTSFITRCANHAKENPSSWIRNGSIGALLLFVLAWAGNKLLDHEWDRVIKFKVECEVTRQEADKVPELEFTVSNYVQIVNRQWSLASSNREAIADMRVDIERFKNRR